jgi:IS30 family transposase
VLAGIVTERLQHRWSPQQIAGWLKLTYPDDPRMQVSHESIYRTLFVQARGALRKELTAYLRTGRVIRRAHGVRLPDGRGARPGVNISERLGLRQRHESGRDPGRTINPLPDAGGPAGRQPQSRRRRRRPGCRGPTPARAAGSVTWDQGHEMAEHQRFTDETGIQVYFCDPKSPWQRGSNQNTNGLLRQYLPRRLDFRSLTQSDSDAIARELSDRPRPTLGFKTPSQALAEVWR